MRKLDGFYPWYQDRVCRKMAELAYRMVYWSDDVDPYGFMDAWETGESIEGATERMASQLVAAM